MPPRSIEDTDLLARLAVLFRQLGYEGASLAVIAEVTGLQKSSLYSRFPGGKQQMAADVAAAVSVVFATELLAPLRSEQPLGVRVEQVAANLHAFYRGGALSCLLDMLSFGDPGPAATKQLNTAAAYWIESFATVARAAGASPVEALVRAQDAIAGIEGGLVLARVTGESEAFGRALGRLPELLLDSASTPDPMR